MASSVTLARSVTVPPSTCGFATEQHSSDGILCLDTVTLADLLSLPRQGTAQKHAHKDVVCLPSQMGVGLNEIYIKRQWAWDRRLPRWPDWRDGVSGTPDPIREYDGLMNMRSIGLAVPSPLRVLRDPHPGSPRAALIMTAVPVSRSLAQWIQEGDVHQLSPFARRGLVVAMADVSHLLTRQGLRWRSMKAKHIYPEQLAADQWRLWLIDCEGVRPRATQRQHRRDRRVLRRSLVTAGADAAFLSAIESALFKRPARLF